MHPKYSPIVCPISFAQKFRLVLYISKLKGATLLVVKASIWGVVEVLEYFGEGTTKLAQYKKINI
jgi:hypothetical protein